MSSPCTLPLSHGNLWISPLITRDIYIFFSGIGGGIVLIGPERSFLFPALGFELEISVSQILHSTTVTVTSGFHLRQFQLILLWCRYSGKGIILIGPLTIFLLLAPGFELGTSGFLVLHSITVQQQLLVLTSDHFKYLFLVQRNWWWYCSYRDCENFLLPAQGFEVYLTSCTLAQGHSNFWVSPLRL